MTSHNSIKMLIIKYPTGIQVSMTNLSVIAMIINRSLSDSSQTYSVHLTRPYFDWLSLARVCSIGSNLSKDDACLHLVSALLTRGI